MDWHERLRLLYVAATRARDHLIVSVHRKEGSTSASTAAELFYEYGWDRALVSELGRAEPGAPLPATPAVAEVAGPQLPSFEVWERERAAAFVSASRPVAVSATRLAEEAARALELEALAGVQKDPRDIDLPPWQKGRYGSAIGRAVHGVLQTIDLSSGAGLAEACTARAAAEGCWGGRG
jgi:ATP-dependent exoDNAse (exonuclease V) beta subunit